MRDAIVTYLYPNTDIYIDKFINRINLLSYEKEITIIFFDDKSGISQKKLSNLKYPYEFIENSGSLNFTRYNSFKILKDKNINNIYFQDIDDLFSIDRFKILEEKLLEYDIVCNDLDILDISGKIVYSNFWKKRLGSSFVFNSDFIQNKNIIGLGNTGMKRELLNTETLFSDKPIAYDWFFFYQLLKKNNINTLFTSDCKTYYLQHDANTAGINKPLTSNRITYIKKVKELHYKTLIEGGFNDLENELDELLNKNIEIDNIPPLNFFWWEETLY